MWDNVPGLPSTASERTSLLDAFKAVQVLKVDPELASQIAALFYVLSLPIASERLGWGMGDCKFTSFVPDSCEEASLTLSLQHITLGQPSDKHVFLLSFRVALL